MAADSVEEQARVHSRRDMRTGQDLLGRGAHDRALHDKPGRRWAASPRKRSAVLALPSLKHREDREMTGLTCMSDEVHDTLVLKGTEHFRCKFGCSFGICSLECFSSEQRRVMATQAEQGHRFGGAWTELKLDAVHYYLGFFTRVLKTQPFDLWYIDAFAGSGTRTVERETGGLLEDAPVTEVTEELAGSVLRALAVDPPFSRHVFIEGNESRFRELETVRADYPEKKIVCRHGEANAELRAIFTSAPWLNQIGGRGKLRAVCFLDPYGMNVEWETLELLSNTRAVDVWYLFPMLAVTRQLANDIARVDKHKAAKLDTIFGTKNWREELYDTHVFTNLFEETVTTSVRKVTLPQIEEYARKRLQTLFRYISPPLPLIADGRGQLFSLFCLSNSSSDAAIELIEKGVKATLKKYAGAASRRTSGR